VGASKSEIRCTPEGMTETFAALSESDLKVVDPDRRRGIDDEHHAGVPLKDGHLGVRQIAAKLNQHTRKSGDNTRPVSANGGHHETGHRSTQAGRKPNRRLTVQAPPATCHPDLWKQSNGARVACCYRTSPQGPHPAAPEESSPRASLHKEVLVI
jgi:hypothetical protein